MSIREPYVANFKKVSLVQFKKDMLKYFGDYLKGAYTNEAAIDNFIQLVYDNIKIPTRSTYGAAGYDFYLPYNVPLKKKDNYAIIPTGIKCEINQGYALVLVPRSSAGIKQGFKLRNTIGIIDSDYYNNKDNEGHIMIACQLDSYPLSEENKAKAFSDYMFTPALYENIRLVQGLLIPYGVAINDEDNDTISERQGGTGSTGV